MKYQHRQNGKVMEIVKRDEKKGTLIIRFTDGTTGAITSGTFKRWYTELPEAPETVENLIDLDNPVTAEEAEEHGMLSGDEALEQAVVDPEAAYVAEVMEQKKALGIECPPIESYTVETVTCNTGDDDRCADGSTYAEIGKEIAEQAKEKAKAAKKAAKKAAVTHEKGSKTASNKINEVNTTETLETRVKQLQEVLTGLGYEVKVGTDKKLVAKAEGKRTMHFYVGLRKAVLGFAKDNVPEGMVADRVRNCSISHSFDISYDNLETLKKFM